MLRQARHTFLLWQEGISFDQDIIIKKGTIALRRKAEVTQQQRKSHFLTLNYQRVYREQGMHVIL